MIEEFDDDDRDFDKCSCCQCLKRVEQEFCDSCELFGETMSEAAERMLLALGEES